MKRLTATATALIGLTVFSTAQTPADGRTQDEVDPDAAKTVWEYLSRRYDANGDGKISKEEYPRGESQFARLDKDGNGFLEEADSASRGRGRGARGGRGSRGRGETGDRARVEPPQEGALAPDFELELLYPTRKKAADPGKDTGKKDTGKKEAGKKEAGKKPADEKPEVIKLSSFKGKRPVALIFGSYT